LTSPTTTQPLQGMAAFEAIRHQVSSGGDAVATVHPAFNRLSRAIGAAASRDSDRPSLLDLATLTRHALRFQQEETGAGAQLLVPLNGQWPTPEHWNQVGVQARPGGDSALLQAGPWKPHWMPDVPARGMDGHAAGEKQRRTVDVVPGDPFLASLQRDSYRTRGQRSAVRAAFKTPPGESLAISLPTGDGKSFVFQLLAAMGTNLGVRGVTLVVTPTIALAEDHQIAAEELGLGGHRLAYTSGVSTEERHQLLDRIRDGSQGLCFSSPEAVCSTLHPALLAAAQAGFLRAIVIDEAHLVDAWGGNFRASFQALSGVRAALIDEAPADRMPITLLLSATITATTIETLRTLFPGRGRELKVLSAAQLRPEIEYWVSPICSMPEQQQRVLDAVLHMPRPAILYTTEVELAQGWYRSLREKGFSRVGLMTGKSSSAERRDIIARWRDETLDLVVGTSAFGLGIDSPHVRAVIHACVPETLDRFYQEVGRGGRDGGGSASILIPTFRDKRIARSINRPRFLTVKRAFERWGAMLNHDRAVHEGQEVFKLPVDVPPGVGSGRQDMGGDLNTEWHIRTLTLMANAGMVQLLGPDDEVIRRIEEESETGQGLEDGADRVFNQYQRVRILDTLHPNIDRWEEIVSPLRDKLVASSTQNFERMLRVLDGGSCISGVLAPIYEIDLPSLGQPSVETIHVALACAGCPDCRAAERVTTTELALNANLPWPAEQPLRGPAQSIVDRWNRVVVFYDDTDLSSRRRLRRWTEAMAKLVEMGVTNWIIPPSASPTAVEIQESARPIPLFHARSMPPNGLPPGHTGVILPRGELATTQLLRERQPGAVHVLFIHNTIPDPEYPMVRLSHRFGGRLITLDQFMAKMNS